MSFSKTFFGILQDIHQTRKMEDNARSLLLLYNYFYHQYVGVLFALLVATFFSYRMFLGPSRTKKKRFQTSTPTGESCLCAVVSGCSSGIGLATVRELLTKTKLNVIGIDIARVHDLGVKSNRFSSFKCDVEA